MSLDKLLYLCPWTIKNFRYNLYKIHRKPVSLSVVVPCVKTDEQIDREADRQTDIHTPKVGLIDPLKGCRRAKNINFI
jgi:hypothetical protein